MWSIPLVGLFNSIMFPSIFTMGIEKLGSTGDGSGVLIMAIVGGAIIPEVQGEMITDQMGLHHANFVPAIYYLYIEFTTHSAVHGRWCLPKR